MAYIFYDDLHLFGERNKRHLFLETRMQPAFDRRRSDFFLASEKQLEYIEDYDYNCMISKFKFRNISLSSQTKCLHFYTDKSKNRLTVSKLLTYDHVVYKVALLAILLLLKLSGWHNLLMWLR